MDEKQAMIASLINNLIRDEWEAIEGYNSVIATLADSEGDDIDGIISNLEDIRDEEYVHVGQLESCLSVLKGDPVEQIDDGSEEGFEKLELPEEEDEDDKGESEYEETDGLETKLEEDREWTPEHQKRYNILSDNPRNSRRAKYLRIKRNKYGLDDNEQDELNDLNSVYDEYGEPKLETESLKEGVSTEEMKNVICSMINEYDASEEEVYDELSSATPDVSRDLVHRLYQMCSGNKEEPQQETSFENFWNELEDTEED